MKAIYPLFFLSVWSYGISAQPSSPYLDSLNAFQGRYVSHHEVVRGSERKFFRFYPVDSAYHVEARFVRIENGPWFQMSTTGKNRQVYRQYADLRFTIHGKELHLFAYQSQYFLGDPKYKDYLFAPFTDSTSGEETYGAGRYLDISLADVRDGTLVIDFNKAYNPYCAYSPDYECPIPPRENDLPIYIRAGEKNFGKKVH